jgi:hypothetical protein
MNPLDPNMDAVLSALDFGGNRRVRIQTVTMPGLKKAHPFASATGRATTTDHGLLKFSEWEMVVGGGDLYGWLVNCLWQVIGKTDSNGVPRQFKAQGAFYERRRRADGTDYPWATAVPKGKTEPVLYLPGQVVATHAHRYEHNGTPVANTLVDGVWTREDRAPKTQEVDAESRFIRWRAPKVASIASVKVGDTVTEGLCIDEFRAAVERVRVAENLTNEEIGKLFSVGEKSVKERLKVLLAADYNGHKAGDTVTLPAQEANDLIAAGKASLAV